MARLPYADPAALPADRRHLLDTLSDADADDDDVDDDRRHSLQGGTLNVYRALGRNVALLEGFRAYASVAWEQSRLAPHERETLILATAYHADSAYEWHQHVRVALDEGIDPAQILAISQDELDRLESERAALAAYARRFVEGSVDDDTHDRLATHYDDDTILGVAMLAGCYLGLAHVIRALGVDLETEFVGWELENL